MWDLPKPGLEPVSPALADRLSTTAPPGKPLSSVLSDGKVPVRGRGGRESECAKERGGRAGGSPTEGGELSGEVGRGRAVCRVQ